MSRLDLLSSFILFIVFVVSVTLAPPEATLSYSQKIFYLHVPAAVVTYGLIAIGCVAFFIYILKKNYRYCVLVRECLRVSFFSATIVLVTGSLWAKYAWNAFFHFEPRLVSFTILWLLLLASLLGPRLNRSTVNYYNALLILCLFSVPFVKFSLEILPENFQLHPKIISRGGLTDPRFEFTLYSGILFQFAVFLSCLRLSYKIEKSRFCYMYG
ncbi:MAG: cytochrome c biogenesis protein CcsA [Deltaproteobacteria bacterium]|nr:cytochrome c biogenesis protein CcsA [Deltaproteobacteria bacterium]